ncbi:hypothetical protein E4T52_00172 [Aureobasidium sp. EXF-3400]|nr:hypothetical protein E4T51_02002 [Aureobasidium sp. EXF-12344]KAI4784885.1 hypothetical protein E4T52_00172 [Aureobasidium sp. EXF-3400]
MLPRSREILDSEDEDDLVVAAPTLVATIPSGEDAPIDMDVDQSTASTEELLRRAQLALMAPTQEDAPVVNFSDLAATSADTSPSSTHKKRPLDDAHPQPRSSGKLKRIKIVTKPEPQYESTDLSNPSLIPPFDGTNDTIPGPTLPSAAGLDVLNEEKTPKTRQRNSSQQQTSSADQMNSLTPWSGTVAVSSDRTNSDDAAIGLPKEMYVPRPSRSRSAQVDTSQIDYSVVVEKTVKNSRPRRSITDSADHITSAPMFPEHPIDKAPEFERLSPTPEAAHPKDSTHPTSTVPEPLQASSSATKSSKSSKKAPAKQPAKRGRPKKKVVEDEEDELAHEDDTVIVNPKTPASASKTEVQVVIEARPNSDLAADIYARLKEHKSREPTPKPPQDQHSEDDMAVPSQASVKDESMLEADDESEDEIVKPRSTARSRANAKSKAKSKTPEPVYKDDDDSEQEVYDEYAEEVVKPKAKSKAKPKAKPKAKGKAAKAVVVPDPPSDHGNDVPEPPLTDDDGESEADGVSEAEEDSEEESPKPKPKAKAKTKAKPEPKSKANAKTKAKATTPIPAAATPKPPPPVHEAETTTSVPVEVSISDAVVTPKVATVKKDAKSSAKPSWQQSTYRVGLSKTQRIPSLLKVFKK